MKNILLKAVTSVSLGFMLYWGLSTEFYKIPMIIGFLIAFLWVGVFISANWDTPGVESFITKAMLGIISLIIVFSGFIVSSIVAINASWMLSIGCFLYFLFGLEKEEKEKANE